MNSQKWTRIIALMLFTAVEIPLQLAAQDKQDHHHLQVVGSSNLTGDQGFDGFVWDRATGITDLGTLGGSYTEAWAINQKGEIVGGSTLTGDLQEHAVLWRKKGGKWQAKDLGTINGSTFSFAVSINDLGQVVGFSDTAFLWEDGGPMVDLNTLVTSNSGMSINGTATINDRGEIAAGRLDSNGNNLALLLIPCDENHPGVEGCDYSLVDASTAVEAGAARAATLPAAGRNNNSPIGPRGQLRARFAHRAPGFGVRSQELSSRRAKGGAHCLRPPALNSHSESNRRTK